MKSKVSLIVCALLLAAAPAVRSVEDDHGLRIESLIWKPGATEGSVLELRYKLVGVEELPRHPSVTYILDPEGSYKVPLLRPAMLPPSADDPAEASSATLILRDESGRVRPGQRVTVVVAGLVRSNVLVETEDRAGGSRTSEENPESVGRPDTVPLDATLDIVKLGVTGGGYLLDIRYRLSGTGMVLADERTTYVEQPGTGEKLYVLGVARIGTLATKDAGPGKSSYLLIQNPERKIKAGDRVNVVVAGIRAEGVLVE